MGVEEEEEENPWCYIGRRPKCNCVVAAAVDEPEYAKETRKFVSDCLKSGLVIDRMRVVDVRREFGCDHYGRAKQQEALPL